ncbi:MAG: hypothetical protein ACQESN_03405 [Thermotogota bacterium]
MYKSNLNIKNKSLQRFLKYNLDFQIEVTPYSKFVFNNNIIFLVVKNKNKNHENNLISNSKV